MLWEWGRISVRTLKVESIEDILSLKINFRMQKHAVSISSNPSESCELIYILENEILKETSLVSSCLNFE